MAALDRGSVVLVRLDPISGHEQAGTRPCVVVSPPEVNDAMRFPLIAVVPLTRTPGRGILYPWIPREAGGLTADSYALADQVRSIDKARVVRIFGRVADEQMAAVDDGLRAFLGL